SRYALVASPNKELQIVPLEGSSSGDLLTKSGIFANIKFLFNYMREKVIESIWHLQFDINEEHEWYMEWMTSNNLKQVFSELDKLFSEQIANRSKYEDRFNKEQFVKKVVVTVPEYFNKYFNPHRKLHSLISSAIEAA